MPEDADARAEIFRFQVAMCEWCPPEDLAYVNNFEATELAKAR